jgi:hypothetical protein
MTYSERPKGVRPGRKTRYESERDAEKANGDGRFTGVSGVFVSGAQGA